MRRLHYIFFSVFLLLLFSCTYNKDPRLQKVASFFNAIRNYKIADSNIVKSYIEHSFNDSIRSYIWKDILPLARQDISRKNIDDFSFVEYKNLNKNDQKLLLSSNEKIDDVFAIKYKRKPYMFILFSENSKIITFITLSKGEHNIFLDL